MPSVWQVSARQIPQDQLDALRRVLGVRPPAPAVSSNFVLPVEQLSDRRRNDLLLVARPIVQSVLKALHDRDPGGVLSALLANRGFRAAAGMDTHAAASAAQLQQDPTMQRILEAFQSAADLGLKPLQNQLLSLGASDHSRATLCELFNCSGRQVNNAREHTALYGRGKVLVSSRHPRAPSYAYAWCSRPNTAYLCDKPGVTIDAHQAVLGV